MNKNKKKIVILITSIIVVLVIVLLVIYITKNEEEVNIYKETKTTESVEEPEVKEEEETEVDEKEKTMVENWLPFVYAEVKTPYESSEILTITLDKMYDENSSEDIDLSEETVNEKVKEIFGEDVYIDKNEVSDPDVSKSMYYYNTETDTYEVIPIGLTGMYKHQIVKEVTKKDDMIYVYTYVLIGIYSYEEDDLGNISNVCLVIGDKDGLDLSVNFDSIDEMKDNDFWIDSYANMLPIYRYSIKDMGDGSFVLEEVERIGY